MNQDKVKQQLIEKLNEMFNRSDLLKAHLRDVAPKDWEELATFRENDEVVEALDVKTQSEILELKSALIRMKEGSWGVCTECGSEIGAQRLEVLPTVRTCIKCAQALEDKKSN